jgi:RNA polymerase sigma-70 factor, ECF subfamily
VQAAEATLLASFQKALEADRVEAWEDFVRQAHGVIATTVFYTIARWRTPQKDLIEDLVQETFLKLCSSDFALLRRFRSDRPEALVAYIRTIASSVVADSQRSLMAQKRGAGEEPVTLDALHHVSEQRNSTEVIEREMLLKRIDRCLFGQPRRDRLVFWLYYRHGLTTQAISTLKFANLTSSGVESLIRRLTITVRRCLRISGATEPAQPAKGKFQ